MPNFEVSDPPSDVKLCKTKFKHLLELHKTSTLDVKILNASCNIVI